ncbi:unnamed protein product, partial [Aphanomyces euteiches]
MPALSLPIPDDFFDLPPLPPVEVARFRAFGHQILKEQVEVVKLKYGPIEWSMRSKTATASVFEGRESNVPMFLARTEIEATLEDAIAVFQTTTVAGTRQAQAEFQPLVLDKVRLYN